MFVDWQYQVLKRLVPQSPGYCSGKAYLGTSKLERLLGRDLFDSVAGKTVIDFGCGEGVECVELARMGAHRVIGIDIQDRLLERAARLAEASGVSHVCEFTRNTEAKADIIVSLDGFEHFSNPGDILRAMSRLLAREGRVLACFGPTWRHPLGGHSFSAFPWAHLLVSEQALIKWRSQFKTDGATRFGEVAGGLNQITIRRFERLVAESPLEFSQLECVPIRRLRAVHTRWTREFTTAVVKCHLVRRDRAATAGSAETAVATPS
jgi:SAM-dependent methyltransferase